MSAIADITDTEKWTVRSSLAERWGNDAVNPQIVDAEARLNPDDRELADCPALYWEHNGCHFGILKTGQRRYRTPFYYANREQFGTSVHEYEDLGDCVLNLLRLQADHERSQSGLKIP